MQACSRYKQPHEYELASILYNRNIPFHSFLLWIISPYFQGISATSDPSCQLNLRQVKQRYVADANRCLTLRDFSLTSAIRICEHFF